MTLGRCTFGTAAGESIRCHRQAEQLRETPGRQWPYLYPVCDQHAEVIDRFFDLFPGWSRSEELRYRAEDLIKEAQRLIGDSQDLRSDPRDDQGWLTD